MSPVSTDAGQLTAIHSRFPRQIESSYDFIVCAQGPPDAWWRPVLPSSAMPAYCCSKPVATTRVRPSKDPARWLMNLGSQHDWAFERSPLLAHVLQDMLAVSWVAHCVTYNHVIAAASRNHHAGLHVTARGLRIHDIA